MLRIFQTGDNHIGLKYAGHEKADILISARILAFEKMVAVANAERCDLFVVTGDLFENNYSIAKKDVRYLVDMLSGFKGTVVVLPGNHDYYDKDARVWQYFQDAASCKDNIMLLTEYRPYPLTVNEEKVLIYPAHCTSLHSEPGENNLGWIKAEKIVPDDTYRIGIAHGAVQGETIDTEGQYFMMTRSELESIPVDVWLIGHTHVPFPANLTEDFSECEKILNAGTHVQTNFNCNSEGYCFIVEIDDGRRIRAKKVKTGSVFFRRKYIILAPGEMDAILERETADIPDNSVVDLILTGTVTAEEYDNRASLTERHLSRFPESSCDDSALSKLISGDLINAEFAETSFSGKLLTRLLDEPKEAQLVYEMLKGMERER